MNNSTESQATLGVSESVGRVSCLVTTPPDPAAVFVLAHGAGAGMRHPFMTQLTHELVTHNLAVVRYNFPFIEAGRKRPDPPAIAMATVEAVIEFAHNQFQGVPLFAGGKSFGGRMTSHFMAKKNPKNIMGICFFGFPLHPPGMPGTDRADHLHHLTCPMLFLQGTRDALATEGLIREVCSRLPKASLIMIEGADHSFALRGQNLIPELARHTAAWISSMG